MGRINKITIIGVGLIGGSIGLAVKKRRLARIVCGVGRRISTLKTAKAIGAIDTFTRDLTTGIKDADLVIIATPVSLIPKFAILISSLSIIAKKELIITDTGSVKDYIVSRLDNVMPPNIHFVGSHPFAGSEKSGARNASERFLPGARVFVTPTKNTNEDALEQIKKFWSAIGLSVITMPAKEHDRLVAKISHLPHILAAALVNSVSAEDAAMASTGFFDTTRIAAGDALMWRDICLSNSENILKAVEILNKNLSVISEAVKNKDAKSLMRQFEAAKKKREKLN